MSVGRAGRVVRTGAAAAVAGIAAIASYAHMRQLALDHGQPALIADLMPVTADGLLTVAAVVMAEDRAAGRPVRASAWAAFLVGVSASVSANVLAAPPSLVARIISAWPAVALLLVVELLARSGGKVPHVPERADGPDEPADRPDAVDEPAGEPDPMVLVAQAVAAELTRGEQPLTRDRLAEGIRARGHSVGTGRASELLRTVRDGAGRQDERAEALG